MVRWPEPTVPLEQSVFRVGRLAPDANPTGHPMQLWIWTMLLTATGDAPPKGAPAVVEAAFDAQVIRPNVYALSGPGENYYPTSLLREGEVVTVVGSTAGDWLAIRPPTGSFSWLPAESLEENKDGTATVRQSDTKLRVGSSLSDARHVHQLVLDKGDRVQIVDEQTLAGTSGPERWFKVVSPTSERRYVPADALRVLETGTALARGRSAVANESAVAPVSRPAEPIAARAGARVIPPAEPVVKPADQLAAAVKATDPAPHVESPSFSDDPSKPLAARIDSLRKELGEMRGRQPSRWKLDDAKRLIDSMSKAAQNDADKAAIGELAALERQMRILWDRYVAVEKRREAFLRRDREISLLLRQAQERLGLAVARFDAEGTLRRSAVSINNQLTYVLEDTTGTASHYVLFAPGLSGESYVGQRVGLIGKISRRADVPIPRIDVEQVTVLQ